CIFSVVLREASEASIMTSGNLLLIPTAAHVLNHYRRLYSHRAIQPFAAKPASASISSITLPAVLQAGNGFSPAQSLTVHYYKTLIVSAILIQALMPLLLSLPMLPEAIH